MPKVVKKIENSPPLRAAVIILFVFFGLLAILVNAVNRTDQEERESQLRSKVEEVRGSVERVQTLLIKSKGTLNEAERRRQVLESVRDQYVIEHPEVPVTMITGNLWPPKPWMDKRLKELGEPPFVPPPTQTNFAHIAMHTGQTAYQCWPRRL
jgi:TolA-binding protein